MGARGSCEREECESKSKEGEVLSRSMAVVAPRTMHSRKPLYTDCGSEVGISVKSEDGRKERDPLQEGPETRSLHPLVLILFTAPDDTPSARGSARENI